MADVKQIYIPAYRCSMCGAVFTDGHEAHKCFNSHVNLEYVMGFRFRPGERAPEKVVLMDDGCSEKFLYKRVRKLADDEEDWS